MLSFGSADGVLRKSDKLPIISPIIGAADAVLKDSDKVALMSAILAPRCLLIPVPGEGTGGPGIGRAHRDYGY